MAEIVIFSLMVIFSPFVSASESSISLPPSDCTLKGTGTVFDLDRQTGVHKRNDNNSYSITALRFPISPNQYFYEETKTFTDGRPNQITMFMQSNSVTTYEFSSPEGSLKSFGVCTRVGHCIGTLIIPSVNFVGRMITDFDKSGIKTVTFSNDGSFVDEMLAPVGACPF